METIEMKKEEQDFQEWSKRFWKHVGEKPCIYTVNNWASLEFPALEFFKAKHLIPLPGAMRQNMYRFVGLCDVIKKWGNGFYASLVNIAIKSITDNWYGKKDALAWAERFLHMNVGERPEYDEHSPRESMMRIGKWKNRCYDVELIAKAYINTMAEFLLRHCLCVSRYPLEKRHSFLEWFARELFIKMCLEASVIKVGSQRHIYIECSHQEWESGIKQAMPQYINNASVVMKRFCEFSKYDFNAVSGLVGNELPQMSNLLEAQATKKIDNQLRFALAELEKFIETVNRFSKLGAARENECKLNCKILKYDISVRVTDVGKGLTLMRNIKRISSAILAAGEAAVIIGAIATLPPLGIGAAATICAALCDKQQQKKDR